MRLFRKRKPLICVVEDEAIGGGLGVGLVRIFVLPAKIRVFGHFNRLGIHQGFELSVTMQHMVGPQVALLLIPTGRWGEHDLVDQ